MTFGDLRLKFYHFRKFSKCSEYWAYGLNKLFNSHNKTRFIVFAQARTGSTLLIRLLWQHPEIYCDNELFQKAFKNPVMYANGRSLMTTKNVYGMKVIPSHLIKFMGFHSSKPLIHSMYNNGWYIVYLRRSNIYRHAISHELAKKRGLFFKRMKDFEKAPKLHIDPNDFKKALKARFKFKQDEQEALNGLPHKEMVYDTDLLTPDQRNESLPKLYDYLGVNPAFKTTPPFIRSSDDDLSTIIENYDEIVKIAKAEGVYDT